MGRNMGGHRQCNPVATGGCRREAGRNSAVPKACNDRAGLQQSKGGPGRVNRGPHVPVTRGDGSREVSLCELEREGGPDGHWVKSFYGMSSAVAMKKHSGGVANYRSSEGKAITVPCTFVLRLFVSSLPALLLLFFSLAPAPSRLSFLPGHGSMQPWRSAAAAAYGAGRRARDVRPPLGGGGVARREAQRAERDGVGLGARSHTFSVTPLTGGGKRRPRGECGGGHSFLGIFWSRDFCKFGGPPGKSGKKINT